MKKVRTAAAKATKNFSQLKPTIELDMGDSSTWKVSRAVPVDLVDYSSRSRRSKLRSTP